MKKMIRFYAIMISFTLIVGCTAVKERNDEETRKVPGTSQREVRSEEPYRLSFMTITHDGEPMEDDSPVKKKIEEYTDTQIDFIWVPNSTYEDKLNITLASGDLPTIITVPQKTASIISAAKSGAFWEIGPYLKEYKNLSQANPIILENMAINGGVYGVYRYRPLGRNGITYRKDWFDRLGLERLETIEDFYEMLKAFAYGDPDNNGKNDTYGLAMSKYSGPFNIMQVWFGVPNKWGEDGTGKLIPAHDTEEYIEALRFFRKLYEEKLINSDFPVLDSGKWMDLMKDGEAGCVVDVADHARRLQDHSDRYNREHQYDVIGAVAGERGLRNLPTSGYYGFHAITKVGAKTEVEMKRALQFLDDLNDQEMQNVLNNGMLGRHYIMEDGYAVSLTDDDPVIARELGSVNQIHMGIPEELIYTVKQDEIKAKVQTVMKENEKIVVPNPAEAFTPETYGQKGTFLDNIIEDARTKFIVGLIDEQGLQEAHRVWERSGGADVIREINEEYIRYKK